MTEAGKDLRIAVAAFAARPRVLVAVDFDGTLAPFVTDPLQARALPGDLEALRAAAALGGVTAAVVSGRDCVTMPPRPGWRHCVASSRRSNPVTPQCDWSTSRPPSSSTPGASSPW